jgi:hypothetical protein
VRPLIFFALLLTVPAIAHAADAPDTTVRVRFTTTADADAIQRAACAAETSLDIGGVKSVMAVRVERSEATVSCTAPPDAKQTLVVHIGAANAGQRDVTLEVDLGKETSLQTADEMLEALHATTSAFEHRIPVPPPPVIRVKGPLSSTLTGFGIGLGITGIGTIAASYIWLAVLITQPTCSQPLTVKVPVFNVCVSAGEYLQTEALEIAGVATVVLGATLALIGQLRVVKPTKSARFVPIIAPIRGGVSTGLAVTF